MTNEGRIQIFSTCIIPGDQVQSLRFQIIFNLLWVMPYIGPECITARLKFSKILPTQKFSSSFFPPKTSRTYNHSRRPSEIFPRTLQVGSLVSVLRFFLPEDQRPFNSDVRKRPQNLYLGKRCIARTGRTTRLEKCLNHFNHAFCTGARAQDYCVEKKMSGRMDLIQRGILRAQYCLFVS